MTSWRSVPASDGHDVRLVSTTFVGAATVTINRTAPASGTLAPRRRSSTFRAESGLTCPAGPCAAVRRGPHQLTPADHGPGRTRSCAVHPPRPVDRHRRHRPGRDRPRRRDAALPTARRCSRGGMLGLAACATTARPPWPCDHRGPGAMPAGAPILLPTVVAPRQADTTAVIGTALQASVRGISYRRISTLLDRPLSTVRRWIPRRPRPRPRRVAAHSGGGLARPGRPRRDRRPRAAAHAAG